MYEAVIDNTEKYPALNKFAADISGDLLSEDGIDREAVLDPMTIAAIVSVLINLGSACATYIQNRKKTQEPGVIEKFRLKQFHVRPALGRKLFKQIGENVTNAIFKLGRMATPAQVDQIIQEAKLAKENS